MELLKETGSLLCNKPQFFVHLVSLKARVEEVVDWAWDVFQPLLFGLIGAEIRVSELEGHTVGETRAQSMHNS